MARTPAQIRDEQRRTTPPRRPQTTRQRSADIARQGGTAEYFYAVVRSVIFPGEAGHQGGPHATVWAHRVTYRDPDDITEGDLVTIDQAEGEPWLRLHPGIPSAQYGSFARVELRLKRNVGTPADPVYADVRTPEDYLAATAPNSPTPLASPRLGLEVLPCRCWTVGDKTFGEPCLKLPRLIDGALWFNDPPRIHMGGSSV
ncbi:MAG: hypothetical protein J5J06_05515 [Phycisphaerae bacterium]|nr:hypothetical protein [Phycisphaerae bacterium]